MLHDFLVPTNQLPINIQSKPQKSVFKLDCKPAHLFNTPSNLYAQVAQSVEQRTENPRVGGSIPPLGTIFLFLYVLYHLKPPISPYLATLSVFIAFLYVY